MPRVRQKWRYNSGMSATLTRFAVKALDSIAHAFLAASSRPARSLTGQRGEEEAYFYLRNLGYTMVARNWRSARRRGEIDLIGWEGAALCFIEVKTRTTRAVKPAEAAVDNPKQDQLRSMARDYLRRMKQLPEVRFDVVSIYFEDGVTPEVTLFRNAFG